MSVHMPQAGQPRSVRSRLGLALALVAITGLATLTGGTSAWGSPVGTTSSSGSGVHVLGVPLGAAIWILLGLVAVVVGVATVGTSRNLHATSAFTARAHLDDQVAVAAV